MLVLSTGTAGALVAARGVLGGGRAGARRGGRRGGVPRARGAHAAPRGRARRARRGREHAAAPRLQGECALSRDVTLRGRRGGVLHTGQREQNNQTQEPQQTCSVK